MERKFILIALLWLAFAASALAQVFTVEGQVKDEEGETIVGAMVAVKNAKTMTMTDADGRFVLERVKYGDILVFTYLGMESKEVAAEPQMTVVMISSAEDLDEVLVVAFGQQKRSSFTGSAAVVDSKKLEMRQITNVMDALNGQVAGLQMISNSGSPDATPTMLIRGISSINSGTEPLIVVDGSPYEGGWNNINPADIESMTVLKDAASNALYGARGANGVIMITTKQAAKGEAKITLDARCGANMRGSELYDVISNPAEYYETHYKALYNYYTNVKYYDAYTAHATANQNLAASASEGGLGYQIYTVPEGQWLIGENGRLNPNASLGYRVAHNGQYYTLLPDNWVEAAYKTSVRQEYNVNVNGGNDKAQFYASLGYLNNDGIVDCASYERYTARMKATYQVKKWLAVGGNINYSHANTQSVFSQSEDSESMTNLFYMLATTGPIYPLYLRDANGNVLTDTNGRMYDYGNGAVNGVLRPVLSNLNPLQTNILDTSSSVTNAWNFNGFADIMPLEGLKITVSGSASDRGIRSTNTVNPFYGYGGMTYPGGYVYKSDFSGLALNFQQLVNYSRSFGRHNLSVMAGHEYYRYTSTQTVGSKQNMASYFGNQELAGAVSTVGTSSTSSMYNTEGYLFRALYDFSEKYYANVSFRRDASSRFHPKHRWGNFYSFGAAWISTKEAFLSDIDWLGMLKFKASYGQQGNDNIGSSFRYTDTYSIENLNGDVALKFSNKGNEDITWETNSNFNAGVEFELFRNRLSGGVEYFYRKTTDMLMVVNDPLSSGYTGHYDNIGDMLNSGVEIELRVSPVRRRHVTWNLNANLTHYRNCITYLSDENKGLLVDGYQGQQSGNYFIGEGVPMFTWYMPKYTGVDEQGQATFFCRDAQGNPSTTTVWSDAEYGLCGDPTPDVYGGFGTSLSAYGFDLSVNFGFSVGGTVFDAGYQTLMTMPTLGTTGNALHRDVLKAWSLDNTDSEIPRLQFNDTNAAYLSDRWLCDGSWLSLQSVNLSYTLPKAWVSRLKMQNIRVYVGGENLFYWSHRRGLDPRSTSNFNGYTSLANYVPTRTITGGVTLQF